MNKTIQIKVTITDSHGVQTQSLREMELKPDSIYVYRDMNGDLWCNNEQTKEHFMLEKSPVNVPEDHFYCIVCKTAKPFTVEGGFGGSLDLGGFMCEVHAHQDK